MKSSMKSINKLILSIPFSYMRILKKNIGDPRTVLDLGCGDGTLMELLSEGEKWKIAGVDLFAKNVKKASQRNIFTEVFRDDIVKFVEQQRSKRKKYDVVFCSQVIEHIDRKKGEELLSLIESIAGKRVVIGTPRGFMEQPHGYLGNNPHQVHKSGWSENDFRKRNYKVFGIGFYPFWSEDGLIRISNNKIMLFFYCAMSFLLSPIVYFIPHMAAGILCIKNIKR